MEQDRHEQQDLSTELNLHQKGRKAHLKRAISILTEGSKDKDYDDKRSDEAWKHITEASKQQRIAGKISKKAAKHMKKELEQLTSSVKQKDQEEGKNHEASSSSGIDKTSKEQSHPKTTSPCDNCHGTYCDMCNCAKCKNATCESCEIASEAYIRRRDQPYIQGSAPPAWSPQQIKDIAKMKRDDQKRKQENREGRRKEAEEKRINDAKRPRSRCRHTCAYGAMTTERCQEDCKKARIHDGLCNCLQHIKR